MNTRNVVPIEFAGLPVSPYTMKMLAYLRFRRLPFFYLQAMPDMIEAEGYPVVKPSLLPTFYLRNDTTGQRQAVTDSTPLIRRFEAAFEGRSTLPEDPALRFVVDLIEDYADEWMTKMMFHYRWAFEENAELVREPLVYAMSQQLDDKAARQAGDHFAKRQIGRLRYVGSNETTGPVIEASYARLLKILDELIYRHGFVFGKQPTSADFAIFGQLSQLARFDPVPMSICQKAAPRVSAWVDRMADLSGIEANPEDWSTLEEVSEALQPLLQEIGKTYAPLSVANARADQAGSDKVTCEIDGQTWQQDVFRYQVKCLNELRQSFAGCSETDQVRISSALAGTGCEVFCKDSD